MAFLFQERDEKEMLYGKNRTNYLEKLYIRNMCLELLDLKLWHQFDFITFSLNKEDTL